MIFLNCKTTSIHNTALKNQNWFKEMWLQDTCGQKGHRTVLSDFILYKQQKEKFFKNKKDVIQLLGEPYQVYSNDNSTSTIIYVVFSAIDCKTYSFGTTAYLPKFLNCQIETLP